MATIILSGSLAYDRIMVFPGFFKDHFLPDKLHSINVSFLVPRQLEHFGGTAGNIAYSLALLGERPSLVASVGNDFMKYRAHLDARHVDTDALQYLTESGTATAHIITDKADNQISAFYPGALASAYKKELPIEGETMAVISAGCLDDMRAFPGILREKRVPFLFDPGQSLAALSAEEIRNGIEGAEVVFANDYEFHLIKEKTGWDEKAILEHAQVLVITQGGEGSRVITKEKEERVPAVPVKEAKDPTGAGDAYRAGFIKAMLLGREPVECAKLGSVVAAYCVECEGTQEHTFTIDELKGRYRSGYSQELSLENAG
jgi:adenosine kinase